MEEHKLNRPWRKSTTPCLCHSITSRHLNLRELFSFTITRFSVSACKPDVHSAKVDFCHRLEVVEEPRNLPPLGKSCSCFWWAVSNAYHSPAGCQAALLLLSFSIFHFHSNLFSLGPLSSARALRLRFTIISQSCPFPPPAFLSIIRFM